MQLQLHYTNCTTAQLQLSYRRPIFETSATALCGTTDSLGINISHQILIKSPLNPN